jgi:hypothetical protein
MAKTTENRIRKLERNHRPPPYREVDFGWRSEEDYVELIKLGRAALAGDAAAERLLDAALGGKVTLLPTIAAITDGTD